GQGGPVPAGISVVDFVEDGGPVFGGSDGRRNGREVHARREGGSLRSEEGPVPAYVVDQPRSRDDFLRAALGIDGQLIRHRVVRIADFHPQDRGNGPVRVVRQRRDD